MKVFVRRNKAWIEEDYEILKKNDRGSWYKPRIQEPSIKQKKKWNRKKDIEGW